MPSDDLTKKELTEIFNPIVPCEYSSEQLQEMRALGMSKPDGVSWGSWMGPKKENHTHEALIYMAASGANQKAIAQDLGYTQSRISIILSKPEIKEKVRAVQAELWGGNAIKRFENLLPQSIDVLAHVVREGSTESTKDKLSAVKEINDRALGKAKQSVTVEGNLLADLIHKLDTQETRNVDGTALPSKTKDNAEEFVDEFLGDENYIVGKRDK